MTLDGRPIVKVIGLGNPILGDDGVGHRVAQEIVRHVGADVVVDVSERGGLALAEALGGCTYAIIVDAFVTGRQPPGTVQVYRLADLPDPVAGHTASAHDTSLATALAACQALGMAVPHEVYVVAVEARQVDQFCEELTPAVAAAVPKAVAAVVQLLAAIDPALVARRNAAR